MQKCQKKNTLFGNYFEAFFGILSDFVCIKFSKRNIECAQEIHFRKSGQFQIAQRVNYVKALPIPVSSKSSQKCFDE